MTKAARFAGCGLVLAAVALAGCKKKEEGNATDLGSVKVDTANNQPMDGVSDTQLKSQAQALTPEQAAAAGVAVDSSIHVENLGNEDSTTARAPTSDTATAATATPNAPAAKQ